MNPSQCVGSSPAMIASLQYRATTQRSIPINPSTFAASQSKSRLFQATVTKTINPMTPVVTNEYLKAVRTIRASSSVANASPNLLVATGELEVDSNPVS